VSGWIRNVLGIESPSAMFERFGRDRVAAFSQGWIEESNAIAAHEAALGRPMTTAERFERLARFAEEHPEFFEQSRQIRDLYFPDDDL